MLKKLETELNDRKLRYDGVSVVIPEQVTPLLLRGVPPSMIRVEGSSWEIDQFNANVGEADELRFPGDTVLLDKTWNLPDDYVDLDVADRITSELELRLPELEATYTASQLDQVAPRVIQELQEIQARGMTNFLRTIIYILDTFKGKRIVWGVGRGSSCASYVLFILGLHLVDCIRYNIPMDEFFHD